jgi:hypothetical protein
VFEPKAVVHAFEEATGIRLEPRAHDEWFERLHPVGRVLPRVELYESSPEAEDRFGGRFFVRAVERDDPDEGVRDRGLECTLPERGPQEWNVSGSAKRANVDVTLWVEADEIRPEMEATWAELTAFLYRL